MDNADTGAAWGNGCEKFDLLAIRASGPDRADRRRQGF
jgi:hypothetical protein